MENVGIVRRLFDQAGRGGENARPKLDALDQEARRVIFAFLDPDVVFHEDPRFPEAGDHHGVHAVRSYLARFSESFAEFSFELEDLIGLESDRVLTLLLLTTRGKGSGAKVESHPGWILTIRDEVVVRVDAFLDRKDALEAAGLSE